MVVPLQPGTLLSGPPTPAVTKALYGIRWCVLAMYAIVALRLAQGDGLLPVLSDLIPALAGTYLLRDDPYLAPCHRCLHSVRAVEQGGLTCLPSFMVLSGMNGSLGLIRALSFQAVHRHSTSDFLPFVLFVSSIIYLATSAVCCWAWKSMQRGREGLLDDAADVEHGSLMANEEAMRRAIELARRPQLQPFAGSHAPAAAWQPPGPLNESSEDDPALRLALQASMRAEGGSGAAAEGEEDALLLAAIQQSQEAAMAGGAAAPEAERVIRQATAEEGRRIVQEQNSEFEESLAMDQAREASEREAVEQAAAEEQRQLEEKQRLAAEEAESQRLEEESAANALRAAEEKRARLPVEPAAGEAGRVLLLFRLPSGKRCQRAFSASDCVSSLYDYVEAEDLAMAENEYCLVTQVPRKVYSDREQTLEAAGVQNQSVLLAEVD